MTGYEKDLCEVIRDKDARIQHLEAFIAAIFQRMHAELTHNAYLTGKGSRNGEIDELIQFLAHQRFDAIQDITSKLVAELDARRTTPPENLKTPENAP